MIKARGQAGDGRPVIFLGLSGENMTRLMADEPIRVDLADLGGPPCVVVIVGGRTVGAIVEKFAAHGLIPPGTTYRLETP